MTGAATITEPEAATPAAEIDACWSRIGVWGSAQPRCERLAEVVHCYNCRVFADAGRHLLDRAAPTDYLGQWRDSLARPATDMDREQTSLLVFRLGDEWYGLPTKLVQEVADIRPIHAIPHRKSPVVHGLVNLRGELQICVSMGQLLGLRRGSEQCARGRGHCARLIAVDHPAQHFVFPVSEVHGIERYQMEQLDDVPSTLAGKAQAFVTGVLTRDDRHVGCLDGDLVIHAVGRRLTQT